VGFYYGDGKLAEWDKELFGLLHPNLAGKIRCVVQVKFKKGKLIKVWNRK